MFQKVRVKRCVSMRCYREVGNRRLVFAVITLTFGVTTAQAQLYSGYTGTIGSVGNPVASYLSLSDDLDEDGIPGAALVLDDTRIVGFVTDFDDLHQFNVFFSSERTHEIAGSQAVDFAKVTWLDGGGDDAIDAFGAEEFLVSRGAEALVLRDEFTTGIEGGALGPRSLQSPDEPDVMPRFNTLASETGHSFGVIRGVRLLQTSEYYRRDLFGSFLGTTTSNVRVENYAIAPHLGLVWAKTRGPLSVELRGLALIGYNVGRVKLDGAMVPDLIPGALNRPLYARPTAFGESQSYEAISSSAELRAEGKLQILKATALRLVWSGVAVENLLVGTDRVVPSLPRMHLVDRGLESQIVHNLYCGIEIVR